MYNLKSPLLSQYKNITHAFSTKKGGYSQSPYKGNNLAYHVNDHKETVYKNHLYFSEQLNYPLKRLVHMDQVHGDNIVVIDENSNLNDIPQCDAIMTNIKNTPLMVMVADCIPILIYDPVQDVIAAVHAGRAGTFSNILAKTLKMMQKTYASDYQDILVVLGPSMHQCCYEVGSEINKEAKRDGYKYAIKTENKHYYLGLEEIVRQQLKTLNIPKEHVEFSPYCTVCNTNLFYSYRAENSICGRFCGVLMLK